MKRIIANFLLVCVVVGTKAFAGDFVQTEWTSTYSSPGSSYDAAVKVVADASGNVYVTGFVGGTTSSWNDPGRDFLTTKYNSSGTKLWEAIYNGIGNGSDTPTALVLDSNGDVIVTGGSVGSDGRVYVVTIKYNSDGVQQWEAKWAHPWHWHSWPSAMTVDANRNVYITGYTPYYAGNGYDIITIKYTPEGVEQWVAGYNDPIGNGDDGAFAIAADGSGNVYVAGTIGGSTHGGYYYGRQYGVIKYNTDGVQQWVAKYDGPAHGEDLATAMVVDVAGNVYVTGYSDSIAYSGPSGSYYDYATVKFNTDGVEQWASRYNGPGNNKDVATSIGLDVNGNVYVSGYSFGNGTDFDYATVKYDPNGVEQWVRRYNGTGNGSDIANQLAVDAGGNLYVTGGSYGIGSNYDYATVKYDPTGTEQWVARYNGSGNGEDIANSIAIDNGGNVYVTGGSFGDGTNMDYVTVKYSQELTVTIDIKPGSFPNSINTKAQGVIPVAILSTSGFDATTVNPLSVRFGPGDASEVHGMGHIEDVDGDGVMDLLLHFDLQKSGIRDGDSMASLTGQTFSGRNIRGSDSITTARGRLK